MKKITFLSLFLLSACIACAQPHGNEWINYSQKYFKLKIVNDGIYRIDSLALANSGIPLNSIDPQNFSLFGRGEEQYIYISGESDGVFNGNDFIEFYVRGNDGFLDSMVYHGLDKQPNPYHSLFNDTATYFLTWNSNINHRRLSIENDNNFIAYTADNYFFKEELHNYYANYYAGQTDNFGTTDAEYANSEGWFDSEINLGSAKSYTDIKTSNIYSGGPDAIFKSIVVGASKFDSLLSRDHHLKIEYKNTLDKWIQLTDTFFYGYALNRFTYSIAANQLKNSYTDFKFSSIVEPYLQSNRSAVSYIYVKYPHTFNLEGESTFKMLLPDNVLHAKSFLNITNFNASSPSLLYDLTNHKRFAMINNGNNLNVLVPNSGGEKLCYLSSLSQIKPIASLQPVNETAMFTDFLINAPDSAYIIITSKSLLAGAIDYKNYRSSQAGGSHNVVLATVDELYDQFAYGINKNPLAIRGFADFALDKWPGVPKNLFLIGKSVHALYYRFSAINYTNCLVPSFGNPSSDNLLTAGLNGTFLQSAIPTGRLSARSLSDISLYLNKVMEYESNLPQEWMKNILHFGGGSTSSEQAALANNLKDYKKIIEAPPFGGVVRTFLKTTTAPIQINQSDSLKRLIEGGVSLMTFFGHASGIGFDQSIDNPSAYDNKGKYPFLLANSCYAGDIHSPSGPNDRSSSESFVLIRDKGVIGYLGSVSLGVSSSLYTYSLNLYKNISKRFYGQSIGKCMQEAIVEVQKGNDQYLKNACNEMTLHGDPAIIINSSKKPDYVISNSNVYFDMKSQVDSFTIFAVETNVGKAVQDSFVTRVIRTLPDGETQVYLKKNAAPFFKDTLAFVLPMDFVNGAGLNKINITLDLYGEIDELSETNNSTVPDINLFINSGDIVPVYPYNYAIVPENTVVLKASVVDPFAKSTKYIFQMDTMDAFLNPLASKIINSTGGVVTWAPGINLQNNSVYYWRVSKDSINKSGYNWRESSFQYVSGKRGWAQAHFFQFKNDDYNYVKYKKAIRQFDFTNDNKSLSVQNGINLIWNERWYKINGSVKHIYTCTPGGFSLAVIDPVSGNPWTCSSASPVYGPLGNYICVGNFQVLSAFDFQASNDAERNRLKKFIDTIPAGYMVLAYTQSATHVSQFSNELYTAFESLGSLKIRTLKDTLPYILWGVKGAAVGSATEVTGLSSNDIITLNVNYSSNWNQGHVASEIIGPARSWNSLHWKQHSLESPSKDSVRLEIIGIKPDGTEISLKKFPKDSSDIYDLGKYINAGIYPNMKLVAEMSDDSLRTSPQLDKWQVMYSPIPEAAINPTLGYNLYKDTLQEGDNIKLAFPIQNISDYDFNDSLLINYWIEEKNRDIHYLPSKLKKLPFTAGSILWDTIIAGTIGYPGVNSLWVEVNALNKPKSQPEQYHFNNISRIDFFVQTDKVNPLLDVTFDETHILNGDIISSRPNILIQLRDENKFLALNDTSNFAVFLKKPSSGISEKIHFDSQMSFIPAVLPKNSCKINFKPQLMEDGIYQLLVQAKDKSNNLSGSVDYKITFEIVNKSTITQVLNYPNPFSTATRFVFTLTGAELPSIFKIQIMTITGKVVKEIKQDELGPIHIGRNITEYAWDGKDEFGDRLANGIYLYRVITHINGSTVEKRQSSADNFFTKDFGKMYLIR